MIPNLVPEDAVRYIFRRISVFDDLISKFPSANALQVKRDAFVDPLSNHVFDLAYAVSDDVAVLDNQGPLYEIPIIRLIGDPRDIFSKMYQETGHQQFMAVSNNKLVRPSLYEVSLCLNFNVDAIQQTEYDVIDKLQFLSSGGNDVLEQISNLKK